jgi:hypothetical protein
MLQPTGAFKPINMDMPIPDGISRRSSDVRRHRKGFDTAFLMLLVFTALYVQIDPRIWTGICQLLARLMIGTN